MGIAQHSQPGTEAAEQNLALLHVSTLFVFTCRKAVRVSMFIEGHGCSEKVLGGSASQRTPRLRGDSVESEGGENEAGKVLCWVQDSEIQTACSDNHQTYANMCHQILSIELATCKQLET